MGMFLSARAVGYRLTMSIVVEASDCLGGGAWVTIPSGYCAETSVASIWSLGGPEAAETWMSGDRWNSQAFTVAAL
jgi:hypothetical protein